MTPGTERIRDIRANYSRGTSAARVQFSPVAQPLLSDYFRNTKNSQLLSNAERYLDLWHNFSPKLTSCITSRVRPLSQLSRSRIQQLRT